MKTNLNICAAAGLTVAFLLVGCGSTEIVMTPPKGFRHPTDVPTAIDQNKAEAGDRVAQFNLALKHDIAGQSASAAEWYQKAADSGLAQAQFNYALMLEKGIAGKQDTLLAVKYYKLAAQQGLVEARYNFALMLAEGRGVLEDDQVAAQWMKRAADQGYANAQFQMGYLHKIGEGVPKDDAEAAKWFLRAAENLHEDAQYYTGLCFAHGIGVEQDLVQAYKWLNLAAAANHALAQRDKEVLTDLMIPEAVAEGQRLSVEFQAAQ
jgi:TPR repeat protein